MTTPDRTETSASVPAYLRLHRALMPDYNRKATTYWWVGVTLGAVGFVHCVAQVAALPNADILRIAAGIAVAMIAGVFPVRIPRSKSSFAAGEIFIFLLLLRSGPAAPTLAAAGEAAV